MLPKEETKILSYTNDWINAGLNQTMSALISELKQYEKTIEPFYDTNDGSYTYTGYFGKMSLILNQINNAENIKNLKSVRIYTTHSLIFDVEYYYINNKRYTSHSPELIIITPLIIIEKFVTVDLSCKSIPGYPDNTKKARQGTENGGHGSDGKPGLLGFNGGNFLVLADNITNAAYLKFISIGGTGGPGQDGKLSTYILIISCL
jgi:hypothetical protein